MGVNLNIFWDSLIVKIQNVGLECTIMEDHISLILLESHLLATLLIRVECKENLLFIAVVFESLPHRSFYKVLCLFGFQKVFGTKVDDTVMELFNLRALYF